MNHHVPNKPYTPKGWSPSQLKQYPKVSTAVVSPEHAEKLVTLLRQCAIPMHLVRQYTLGNDVKFTTLRPLQALHPIDSIVWSIPTAPVLVLQVKCSSTGPYFGYNGPTLSEVIDHMENRKRNCAGVCSVIVGSTIKLAGRSHILQNVVEGMICVPKPETYRKSTAMTQGQNLR